MSRKVGRSNDGRLLLEYQTRQPRYQPFTPVTKNKAPTKKFQFLYGIKPSHMLSLLNCYLIPTKKKFFFLCLYSSHVLKKDKIVSFVYLEFFMYENIPERNLFTCCIAVPSHCFMTLNESPMFIVCLMNGSIYSVFPNMK